MAIFVFIIFILLIFLESQLPGSSGAWSDVSFGWLASFAIVVNPYLRLLFAALGGVFKGTLVQSSWWFEAFAMGFPLLLVERIDKSLFVEHASGRRIVTGAALILIWFIILELGKILGVTGGIQITALPLNLGLLILLILGSSAVSVFYEKVLR